MTKENLIFLGACTIMSSSPYSTIHATGRDLTTTEAKIVLGRAVDWSTSLYDLVHSQPTPKPAVVIEEQWEVQAQFSESGWERSIKAAYEAMKEYRSPELWYRVHKVE